MSDGICVIGSEPFFYSQKFIDCITLGCPDDTELHICVSQKLTPARTTDMNIFFVHNKLIDALKEQISDTSLLELLNEGYTETAKLALKQKTAVAEALRMIELGEAYGPR